MGSTPSWRVAGRSGFPKIEKEREDCSADEWLPKSNAIFFSVTLLVADRSSPTRRNIHEATLLHRLDARPRLRPHVSDALLRLLAQPRSAQVRRFHLVTTWRHSSRTTV